MSETIASESSSVECKKVCKRTNTTLQLAGAAPIPTGADATSNPNGYLSPDGTLAYLTYGNVGGTGALAQFARNLDGTLVPYVTIPTDPLFPNQGNGAPNACFTSATVLDDNTTLGQVRVRVVSTTDGSVLATRVFADATTDPDLRGIGGGTWSSDSCYILVQYALNTSTPTATNSVLRVLAAQPDLPVVASYAFAGLSNLTTFFDLFDCEKANKAKASHKTKKKKCASKYFIGLTPSDLTVVVTGSVSIATTVCPAVLRVLRFTPGSSTLLPVDEASIPAFAVGAAAWPTTRCQVRQGCAGLASALACGSFAGGRFALLAVNTLAATATTEVSPYVYPTPTCPGVDSSELRLYAFDGKSLHLVATQDTNMRGGGIGFTSDGQHLFALLRARALNAPQGCPAEYAATGEFLRVPLAKLGRFIASRPKHSCKKEKVKNCHGAAAVPFGASSASKLSKPLTCLEIESVKGGFTTFSLLPSFSDNGRWALLTGATDGDVFPIQVYRVVSECCPEALDAF